MSDSTLRQRAAKPAQTENQSTTSVASEPEDTQTRVISLLDILRVIITLIGIAGAVSYYITSGESLLYGYKPWFTNPTRLIYWWNGPLRLTPEQLALFNGTDTTIPVYIAINGTVFDVSQGRHTYGPGGSYNVFAGRDATRAFVTGCFLEDTTSNLRGAEEVYIPIEDPDEVISSGEKKTRAERERREAKKKVQAEVQKWENFYKNHKKYIEVGKVIGAVQNTERIELCEAAQKGRPKRKNMKKKEEPGKPVQ